MNLHFKNTSFIDKGKTESLYSQLAQSATKNLVLRDIFQPLPYNSFKNTTPAIDANSMNMLEL
jgi:hypothetical protein